MLELDRDEFEAAVSNGTFPSKFRKDALAAMSKLKADVEEGIFPGEYVA